MLIKLRDNFVNEIKKTFLNLFQRKSKPIEVGIIPSLWDLCIPIIWFQGDLKINWVNVYYFLLKRPCVIHHMVLFIFICAFIANACGYDHQGPINIKVWFRHKQLGHHVHIQLIMHIIFDQSLWSHTFFYPNPKCFAQPLRQLHINTYTRPCLLICHLHSRN